MTEAFQLQRGGDNQAVVPFWYGIRNRALLQNLAGEGEQFNSRICRHIKQ